MTTLFDELEGGDPFTLDGQYYVKVAYRFGVPINAVNLDNGAPIIVDGTQPVERSSGMFVPDMNRDTVRIL